MGEGAYLMFARLQETEWDLAEMVDLDRLESESPFDVIRELLDTTYKFDKEIVEIPERCSNFFHNFGREKNETMQKYLARRQLELKKPGEVDIQLPSKLLGWHLLARSGGRSGHVNVKTHCKGHLDLREHTQRSARDFRTRLEGQRQRHSAHQCGQGWLRLWR